MNSPPNLPAVRKAQLPATVDPVMAKGLPASEDCERAVLGAILLSNEAFYAVSELLTPESFYNDAHRRLFAAMTKLVEAGKGVDPLTLTECLIDSGEIEAAGGVLYMGQLTEGLPRSTNARFYAETVAKKATLRRLIQTSHGIMAEALAGPEDPADLLDRAESAMLKIGEQSDTGAVVTLGQVYDKTYKSMDELLHGGGKVRGVETGFKNFDALTCGLQPGELILIAARPSVGKSAVLFCIAAHVALRLNLPFLIFSLEMSKEAVLSRILCAEARVDGHRWRQGWLQKEEMQRIAETMALLHDAPLYIDDSAAIRLQQVHAKARRLKQARPNLAAIGIDYLQLMTPPKAENRNQEVSAISAGLKKLAKDLALPVVALSQLSRKPENRGGEAGGHRPQLADLRDSGSLEQDADLIALLYRQEIYDRMAGREVTDDIAGRAELNIAKQRNGPTDKVPLVFIERFARFDNIAEL